MTSNHCTVEQLEGRQLFSAATPLAFQGTAATYTGAQMDTLLMTVQQTSNGFTDKFVMTDNSGNIAVMNFSMKANGQFSYTQGVLTVTGKMNAGETEITGTWSENLRGWNTRGTFLMDVIPQPNANLPTTNNTTTITEYTGKDTNQGGQSGTVLIEVLDTDGVRTGEVFIHNYNDQLVPIPFNISSTGKIAFTFSLTDQTDIVQGKLNANGTITGSWTSISSDGTNGFGKFSAKEI
jgi:hypothetical protein